MVTDEQIKEVMDHLTHKRDIHVQWIQYLKECEVGDIEHHQRYVEGYDKTIKLIESLVEGTSLKDKPVEISDNLDDYIADDKPKF
jgi:hypothetical protein